jgi:hypothetical protein
MAMFSFNSSGALPLSLTLSNDNGNAPEEL